MKGWLLCPQCSGSGRMYYQSDLSSYGECNMVPDDRHPSPQEEREMSERDGAKILATWLGYNWDGLRSGHIHGYQVWSFNGIGHKGFQGGQKDLCDIVREIVDASAPQGVPSAVAPGTLAHDTLTDARKLAREINEDVMADEGEIAAAIERRDATLRAEIARLRTERDAAIGDEGHDYLAERDRAEARAESAIRERDAAQAALQVCREALEPFVAHYEKWMDDWADDKVPSTSSRVTFGQLRRARSVLASSENLTKES
jgi:hypothetical protein